MEEFANLVEKLQSQGINVHVVINDTKGTADAVFPNNWFSTHVTEKGHLMVTKVSEMLIRRRCIR